MRTCTLKLTTSLVAWTTACALVVSSPAQSVVIETVTEVTPLPGGGFTLSAMSTLEQGSNFLRFQGTDISAGVSTKQVDTYFGTDRSVLRSMTVDGLNAHGRPNLIRDTEFILSSDTLDAVVSVIDIRENLEGVVGISMDPLLPEPIVFGGFLPYSSGSDDDVDDFVTMQWTSNLSGYVIRQSGSTWYGDLAMDTGTTFSADNLIANSIRTTNLQSTSISANSISATSLQASSIRSNSLTTGVLTVTGNASIGGNLNMNNNRITNVGDGIEPTDAVNVRQLRQTQDRVNALQRESRVGISGVAALAGIPSIPIGSDGVLGVAVGTYKGESSLAIGGSRRVNDKTTIKLGISTPSGNNGVVGSFGVGIKW